MFDKYICIFLFFYVKDIFIYANGVYKTAWLVRRLTSAIQVEMKNNYKTYFIFSH